MIKTIKDVFPTIPKDESDLVVVSDELWKLGNIDEIKEKVSPELFITHISMNIIGNYQCDGWESILTYYHEMFPYIPRALEALCLPDIKKAFQDIVEVLPDLTEEQFDKSVEALDNLSDSIWGLNAPNDGWEDVLQYVKDHYHA